MGQANLRHGSSVLESRDVLGFFSHLNLLLCSHFNFLHLMRYRVEIWCCKKRFLRCIWTIRAFFLIFNKN